MGKGKLLSSEKLKIMPPGQGRENGARDPISKKEALFFLASIWREGDFDWKMGA
ncbi:MAG: hypothetical protein M0041_04475 [Nitrospiraceae bacterium]|nr:hypothetical protein [Nitrospiraceae bacterium]